MNQIPAPLWTLVIGVVVTLISLWLGQNHHWLPEQASEQAVLVDNFFNAMVTMATALFLVVEGAIVYCLIRFRRPKGDDTDGLPIEGNLPLEAFWTAIPAIIVIGLGAYSVFVFQEMGGFSPGEHPHNGTMVATAPADSLTDVGGSLGLNSLEVEDGTLVALNGVSGFGASPLTEGNEPDLIVNITGLQYAWIFNYPDSGITDGELHIPIGKDVQLNIQAQDVIHSFWMPQFRLKQDAIPGQTTELRFVASKEGTFPVVCTELCGAYHGAMRTQVIVHSEADFAAWVDSRIAQGPDAEPVAIASADRSDSQYLHHYSQHLGLDPHAISQLADISLN